MKGMCFLLSKPRKEMTHTVPQPLSTSTVRQWKNLNTVFVILIIYIFLIIIGLFYIRH
jgi:heme/copper-type cytochrome/quinol oxidase subunit 2